MTTPAEVEALRLAADRARAETLSAQLAREAADRRYREAMSNQAIATRRLSDARTALGRGKPLNV